MLNNIDVENIPTHIGIIMDGNGRWAKNKNKNRSFGHKAGVEALRNIVKECSNLGVKFLTVFAFSSENWKRPKKEVNFLMNLLVTYLKKEVKELHDNNVIIKTIGEISDLPSAAVNELKKAVYKTENNSGLTLVLALNYGFKNDMINAIKKIVRSNISEQEINDDLIRNNLSTFFMPDPDLIIRTSNEFRLSNFMMYESAYSELYFTDVLWPDFTEKELHQAIESFKKRDRRFGGLN